MKLPHRSSLLLRFLKYRFASLLVALALAPDPVAAQAIYVPGGTVGNNTTNGNVGIGTNTPAATLEVAAVATTIPSLMVGAWPSNADVAGTYISGRATTAGVLRVVAGGNSPSGASNIFTLVPDGGAVDPVFLVNRAGNVGIGSTAPNSRLSLGLQIGNRLLGLYDHSTDWYGFGIQGYQMRLQVGNSSARFSFFAGDSTEVLTIQGSGNVGIGTTSPSHKLSVNGTIKTKEIIVETTGWADDVFAEGYRLKALGEVEAFIAANKHLPDVPSAATVAERGVVVGEMQATLLRKIEELTLYVIELQKENAALRGEQRQQIQQLHDEIAALRKDQP